MGGPGYFEDLLVDCINDGPESKRKWKPVLDKIRARKKDAAARATGDGK